MQLSANIALVSYSGTYNVLIIIPDSELRFSVSSIVATVTFVVYTLIWAKELGRSRQGIVWRLAVSQFDVLGGFMKSRQWGTGWWSYIYGRLHLAS